MEAVWVLNLDADLELGARGPYTPTRSVLEAMRAQRERLAETLLAPGETVVDEATPPGSMKGRPGLAFCPTSRARKLLDRAGAVVTPSPSHEVLRTVNGRAFCSSFPTHLPGSELVTTLARALEKLASGDRPWRVKRLFGMAGRGQRVLGPGVLSPPDEAFVRASLEEHGGVVIEPNVAIDEEVAIHGMLARDGALALGRIVRQITDPRGVWLATEPLVEPFAFARELEDEARVVARGLHEAGYHGPFGLDAFTHDGGRFQPRSEINARFSMGFPVGMPNWRDLALVVGSDG